MTIDWHLMQSELKNSEDEQDLTSPSLRARAALENILGEDTLRQAVNTFVSNPFENSMESNHSLIRDGLWFLKPLSAMLRCYEICQNDADIKHRRSAALLLISTADYRAMPYVEGLLADHKTDIQRVGAELLDRLFQMGELSSDGVVSNEAERLICLGEAHPDAEVRERMDFIRRVLKERRADQ